MSAKTTKLVRHFTKAVDKTAAENGLDLAHHEQRVLATNLAVKRGRIRPPAYGWHEKVHGSAMPLKKR